MEHIHNHDAYYDPPEDDPYCENGCGDTLERDPWTHEWICPNKFCPTKFSGVEKEMAEALVAFMEDYAYYRRQYAKVKQELETLKQGK